MRPAPLASGVYPRPRGGTLAFSVVEYQNHGLSPPTRGNPAPKVERRLLRRSIPAHAGEPGSEACAKPATAVYPRPRGGTLFVVAQPHRVYGLSPPTRGNPSYLPGRHFYDRSIPAHAGEPSVYRHSSSPFKVYPRPRGGTSAALARRSAASGLSPPTRGNRRRWSPPPSPRGSIPAHAGEPASFGADARPTPVYPRPRGGTVWLPVPLAAL